MTKSSSPKAQQVDWPAVKAWHQSVDTQSAATELAPALQRGEIVEPRWAPEYVWALEMALDAANEGPLIELLDGQRLIHPGLLPLLAEILRRKAQGLSRGKPKKLTSHQEVAILRELEFTRPEKMGEFDRQLAARFNVSERTIANVRTGRKKTPAPSSSS